MKKLLIVLFLFYSGFIFSQENSSAKSDYIFTITFKDSTNNEVTLNKAALVSVDSNNLYLTRIYTRGDNITPPKILNYKIKLDKINSFGYLANSTVGERIGTGAAIGIGTGLVLGAVAGSIKLSESYENHTLDGALGGLIFGAITGSVVGGITAIGAKEYESVNLSSYQSSKKYEVINRLISKGIEFNKDE
ncbi:MAG: glycine zipper family protein [Bacteroidetes bacterium]|nr:glycine zipper family protein [Bacteroidota bacterium]